jgi:hypothetical protein
MSRVSQITWRTSVADHPTEDNLAHTRANSAHSAHPVLSRFTLYVNLAIFKTSRHWQFRLVPPCPAHDIPGLNQLLG